MLGARLGQAAVERLTCSTGMARSDPPKSPRSGPRSSRDVVEHGRRARAAAGEDPVEADGAVEADAGLAGAQEGLHPAEAEADDHDARGAGATDERLARGDGVGLHLRDAGPHHVRHVVEALPRTPVPAVRPNGSRAIAWCPASAKRSASST